MNGRIRHLPVFALLVLLALLVVEALGSPCGAAPSATPSPVGGAGPEPAGTPAASSPKPTPQAPAPAPPLPLTIRDIPEIHGKISLPGDWTLVPGKLLEGDVLLAVKEKISGENDPWSTGLSMSIDRNGAKDSGMKAGDYALAIAKEAREKAGDEASSISDTTHGAFRELRFEFPVQGDSPLLVTEVLRANDRTGTVAVILWQSPQSEAVALRSLRDEMLSGIILDPER